MATPRVTTTEVDGGLNNTKNLSGQPMAVVGPAASGSFNPQVFRSKTDLVAEYGSAGAALDAACYALDLGASSVVVVRTASGNSSSYSTLDDSGVTGTCTPSVDSNVVPLDEYQVYIEVVSGGVIATSGIKYRYSLDGGTTFGPVYPLGTATSITLPAFTGGVKVNLSAGTLVAGDSFSFEAFPETFTDGELSTALDSLASTSKDWEFVLVALDVDATMAMTVATWLATLHSQNKHKFGIVSFRAQSSTETANDYLTAFETFRGAVESSDLVVTADRCDLLSSIPGVSGRLRRPPSLAIAGLVSVMSPETDGAALDSKYANDRGPLLGVSIKDSNGNPVYTDATLGVGSALDDLQATVLRSWQGYSGTYINNLRLLSSPDSDATWLQHRRVLNLARGLFYQAAVRILSKPLQVDRRTGFLSEKQIQSIEARINAILQTGLLVKPMASAVKFTASRNDPILTNPFRFSGRLSILPLAYAKEITAEVAFVATLAA
ncbi:MAG: hypothetical protein H6718_04130 [Polyangiaceae bacterium]|nr:hypothetical protein [Polyangiaceae bacterium]